MICPDDCFIRWGGEEFVLVLGNVNDSVANTIITKIVKQIFEIKFKGENIIFNVSVSVGGTRFLESDTKYEDALIRADSALYHVKTNGKNNVKFEV